MIAMLADSEVTIQAGSGLVFGIICALIANGRGRSGLGWFFIGLFFQCLALIALLVIPDLNVQSEHDRTRRDEVRRLKEQIKKERYVADERHIAARTRLEAHDRALGVDTSEADRRLVDAGMAPPPLPAPATPPPDVLWFYASGGERHGPLPDVEMRQLLQDREVGADALVWRQGMSDWLPVRDVEELFGDIAD